MKHFFLGKQRGMHVQLIRYACAGGSSALIDLLFFAVAVEYFHVHYLLAAFFTYVFGFTWMHILSVVWIFESRHDRKSELVMVLVITLLGLVWTEFILYMTVEWFFIDVIIAKIFAQLAVFIWNFGMRKLFVFH